MNAWNRRRFLLGLLGLAAAKSRAETAEFRRYRADAVILLLGIPVYSRSGVGGAIIAVSERIENQRSQVTIQFAAGSLPQRAAGLNRFGFIEEHVVSAGNVAERSEYIGLMTASPEKDVEQAKRALNEAGDRDPVVAIHGSAGGGRFRNLLLHTECPDRPAWTDAAALSGAVRTMFTNGTQARPQIREGPSNEAATFLYAVRRAVLAAEPESRSVIMFNGTPYRLLARRQPDPKMGARFAARRLVAEPSRVQRLDAKTVNLSRGTTSEFQLWVGTGGDSPLPIRFEYRARPFLRLSFEHEPQPADFGHAGGS